eukprot:TRINITY_DN2864_c1_g5_i1.p1 TRINITY_DN2864_c1_g5~~TRINITY_DN2864_c1_g5_i1.p1  ORF type:complete len:219 (+),score=25.83 TRINITY_DN2864_c1_g5_i1:43-699(+)
MLRKLPLRRLSSFASSRALPAVGGVSGTQRARSTEERSQFTRAAGRYDLQRRIISSPSASLSLLRALPSAPSVPPARRLFSSGAVERASARPRVVQGNVVPARPVPGHIAQPEHDPPEMDPWADIKIKTPEEIERMRASCKLAADVLHYAVSVAKEGVTTEEIDSKCFDYIIEHNAYPSPLQYKGISNRFFCALVCVCERLFDVRTWWVVLSRNTQAN